MTHIKAVYTSGSEEYDLKGNIYPKEFAEFLTIKFESQKLAWFNGQEQCPIFSVENITFGKGMHNVSASEISQICVDTSLDQCQENSFTIDGGAYTHEQLMSKLTQQVVLLYYSLVCIMKCIHNLYII